MTPHLHGDGEADPAPHSSSKNTLEYIKLYNLLIKNQITQLFQKFTLMGNILY